MTPEAMKARLAPFREAGATFTLCGVRAALEALCAEDVMAQLCHPFGDLAGVDAWIERAFAPLQAAMPDLERRDMIVVAGTTPEGAHWAGCMGVYLGTFRAPFLDIPPTGRIAQMRHHEFFEFRDGRVTSVQAIWDVPELMMQAGAWPMAPQLGAFMATPGPATCDGLAASGDGAAAMARVRGMLDDMCRHPGEGGPEVMRLETHWHPRFNWYGPAGVGAARGVAGFRHWHQIPFLRAMPDRRVDAMGDLHSHWIAEGAYVAETGWPNMRLTLSGDGWMGVAPTGGEVLLRSLDFWRLEKDLIRENWVLVDLLDFYRQVGVDVLARLREFNKARSLHPIETPQER